MLTVPFPGKSLFMSSMDTVKAHGADAEVKATKWDLAKQALELYLDCAQSKETLAIQVSTLHDLEALSRTLNRLYEQGHVTQAENIATQLQLRQAQSELLLGQERAKTACEKLELFGGKTTDFSIPGKISSSIIEELGNESADLLRAKSASEQADAGLRTSFWKQLPDLTLSAFQNRYFVSGSSPVGLPLTYSIQMTVTLPIFFPFKELPDLSQDRAENRIQKEQSEVLLKHAKTAQVLSARKYRQIGNRIKEMDEKDLPMADAMAESSLSAYRSGKLGFSELILTKKINKDLKAQAISLRVALLQTQLKCLAHCENEGLK
jgi:outer membrane protein TolC